MAIARRVDGLSAFTGSDLKFVFSLVGVDMTGETGVFNIATAPEASPAIAATVTLIEVIYDDDGVPTSILQAYASKAAVQAAKAVLAPSDEGANLNLYYEFRVSALAGETGSDAETTLMYGAFPIKGSI
ncbi:hypothetical protein [Novosphingobium pentaromativorans]|uniref:Uncharacterized protein n=1 Tax=Novosphingobium pentaromativorans US6-1 TaxID=1088721 RepID=G6E7L2_9SPHN|nr:hypothetical protein [Novosphingobium pentaromativorans]AIT81590.1 hypothetical protein JI59_18350 [Novosphingobium pentaromativorans US6-1]EHJ62835.1 hypothetical protein NSU_0347 [Novosphingobium pentaromativorans US6-1]